MTKTLLICNVNQNTERLKELINSHSKDNIIVLFLNNNVTNSSFRHLILDDMADTKNFKKLEQKIGLLAKTWYTPIESKTKYFDIQLGELVEFEFRKFWSILLKIDVLLKIIGKVKPSEVSIITEYNEDIKIVNEIIRFNKLKINVSSIELETKAKNNTKKIHGLISKLQNLYFKANYFRFKDKNKILFVGNQRQIDSILKELKKKKNNTVIRAGENLGRGFLNENADFYLTFKDIKYGSINEIKEDFIKRWHYIKLNKKFKNNLFYKVPLFNVIEDKLEYYFSDYFIKTINYIETMKSLKNKIDILVVHNDVLPFERTLVKTARKMKIPTLAMIDGYLPISQVKKDKSRYFPFHADRIILFNNRQKKIAMQDCASEKKFIVTGYPPFDEYFKRKKIKKAVICKKLGISSGKNVILYTAEGHSKNLAESAILGAITQKDYEKRYSEIFESIKTIPNSHLIIKQHPSAYFDRTFIENLAQKTNFKDFTIIKDMKIFNLLCASSVLITRLSTTAFEAFLLKVPVIIYDAYTNTNDNFGFTEFNAALHAKKKGDLKELLKDILENESSRETLKKNIDKFLAQNHYKNDGKASKRVAKAIEDMIKKPL